MPFFKTNYKLQTTNYKLFPAETLLPLEKIISLAKKSGVSFGSGNAKERIRYFIKLGILPHAVRKVSTRLQTTRFAREARLANYKLPTTGASQPVAHLPYFAVERLVKIENFTQKGMTFRQIARGPINQPLSQIRRFRKTNRPKIQGTRS